MPPPGTPVQEQGDEQCEDEGDESAIDAGTDRQEFQSLLFDYAEAWSTTGGALDWPRMLRLYASYQKFGFTDLGDSFAQAKGTSFAFQPDTVLFSQARLMVLPIMFFAIGLVTRLVK